MKRYIKDDIIKYSNEIIIYADGLQIINPDEATILANGWKKYVPVPQKNIITNEEKIVNAKKSLIDKINAYDQSNNVNAFYMKGFEMWLDKATRVGLMLRFQSEMAMGMKTTSLWYGNASFELSIENAMQMLYLLEVYASNCYDNTQKHLANAEKLNTLNAIESYNYKEGYPEKLNF